MHRIQLAGFKVDCQTSELDAAAAFRSAARADFAERANTRD